MPLLKNTFQPYFADSDSPAPKACNGTYCYPVASGDTVRQQFYQTPCGENLVEDPSFDDNTLGAELLTNGTFTGSAAGWTLDGNWAYGTDNIQHTPNASPAFDNATQSIAITSGDYYQVETTISSMNAGYMNILLGSGAIKAQYIAAGTYIDVVPASASNTDFALESSQYFDGVVDSVSVKLKTNNSWVSNDAWAFQDGYACKSLSSTSGTLYNGSSDYIVDGDYYEVIVTVSGYGGVGNLTVYVDDGTGASSTNPQAAISADGTYTYYIEATQDGVIGFSPSTTFTGCVSAPSVKRLRQDYPFELVDSSGNTVDVSEFATYVNDKVLLNLDFAEMLEAGTIDDYGCYNIQITDSCLVSGDNLVSSM